MNNNQPQILLQLVRLINSKGAGSIITRQDLLSNFDTIQHQTIDTYRRALTMRSFLRTIKAETFEIMSNIPETITLTQLRLSQ